MLLIKPYLGCNLNCKYCYEKPYRESHTTNMNYDLDLVVKRIEEIYSKPEFNKSTPCLHGGEILCLPKKDVDTLLKKVFELSGRSTIQTNATKIDDEFIEMFKKYKTNIGISWDGPGELSSARPGTNNVGETMEKLVKNGVPVSNIIVVNKANAGTPKKREKLKQWLLELKKIGVQGRINPCTNSPENELSVEDLRDFYLDLADFLIKNDTEWSPFVDVINGLKLKGRVCILSSCDIYNTPSATVIMGDGTVTSCVRTSGEYVLWKDDKVHKTREAILSQVPQEHGGCKGCKFFFACYGGCPSAAIDDDWRNRTYLCILWKALFEYYDRIFRHLGVPVPASESTPCDTKRGGYSDGDHYDAHHGDHFDDQGGKEGEKIQSQQEVRHIDSRGDAICGIKRGGYSDGGHYDAHHGDSFDGRQRGKEGEKIETQQGAKHMDSHGDAPYIDHNDDSLKPKDKCHQDDAFRYNDSGHNDANHGDYFDSGNV